MPRHRVEVRQHGPRRRRHAGPLGIGTGEAPHGVERVEQRERDERAAREYRRLFGVPPGRDALALREAAGTG
jgi:hypothetical protein